MPPCPPRALLWSACALCSLGCASNKMVAIATIDAGDELHCTLDLPRGDDADGALVRRALDEAAPKLARWMAAFQRDASAGPDVPRLQPIAIHLLPDHDALEAMVGQHGFPWLRAWSFARDIYLQAPRSWSEAAALSRDPRFDAVQAKLAELLAHELTHALMYQLLQGGQPDGNGAEPPLWFREGMASMTAGQDKSRMDAFALARVLLTTPGKDLLSPTPELLRDAKDAVYGAAHRAFELLERSCGDSAAIAILLSMRSGASFESAFAKATGRTISEFVIAFVEAQLDPSSDPALCRTH